MFRQIFKFLLLFFVLGACYTGVEAYKKDLSIAGVVMSHLATRGPMTFEESYPKGKLREGLSFDRLVLEKNKRLLTAYSKGQAVRLYLVALGEKPVGAKQYQGDSKTPEGQYTINDKNPNSKYYKNLGISYPNEKDRDLARSLGKSPGGDIKIHGLAPAFARLGETHRLSDWTQGCVAVTNEEMEELYQRVPVGVEIQILP